MTYLGLFGFDLQQLLKLAHTAALYPFIPIFDLADTHVHLHICFQLTPTIFAACEFQWSCSWSYLQLINQGYLGSN